MNQLIVINYAKPQEKTLVAKHIERFGAVNARVVSDQSVDFQHVWKFLTMNKMNVAWTKRFLERFLDERVDVMVKIDPDTVIKTLPPMPEGADVAGDFRKSNMGWIWFGACQYFRRAAVIKLLNDKQYTGPCVYQDVALAANVVRCRLRAYNMPEINGWSRGTEDAPVLHQGRSDIVRLPGGWCGFK